MADRKWKGFDKQVVTRLEKIPPLVVVPASIAVTIVVGGLIPAIFQFDHELSILYVAAGGLLGMLPVIAVLDRLNTLNDRRRLLQRSGTFEGVGRLSDQDFEQFVAAWYEFNGFDTVVSGGTGDGGVDVWATKGRERIAVQCKHWKRKQVGPKEVRELRGSVLDNDVKLVLITSGTFSDAARSTAKGSGVDLIDGFALLARLDEVLAGESPPCPKCQGEMRPKSGSRGLFWSCVKFPTCKGSCDFVVHNS